MFRVEWFAFNVTIGFHGSVRSHLTLIVQTGIDKNFKFLLASVDRLQLCSNT